MIRSLAGFTAISATFLLVACGGGGGGGSASVSATSAGVEGFWSGPASTGYDVSTVILENGETWGIYSSGSTIYGALYGSTTVTSSNITISGTDFDFLRNISSSGSFVGTYANKSSMSLSNPANGSSVALSYDSSYDTAAIPANLTGTFSFTGRSGSYSLIPGSVTINSSGAFNLAQTNCATSGTMRPRANGKNVYDVIMTSAGNGCAVGYATLRGIGYLDTTVNPYRFLILALNDDKSDGLIILGSKN